jgi:hypothetical protein
MNTDEFSTSKGFIVNISKLKSYLMYQCGGLEWTTTPPTKEGWYWAFDARDSVRHVLMIEIAPDGIGYHLTAYTADIPHDIDSYTHWLGPLPIPDLPSGKAHE